MQDVGFGPKGGPGRIATLCIKSEVILSCSFTVGQEQQQSLTKEKMNLKSRFIKKKPTAGNTSTNNNKSPNNGQKVQSRVQRSASAILRSKMYAVVAKKRKISKPTMDQPSAEENNIGMLFRVNQKYFKTLISKLSQIKILGFNTLSGNNRSKYLW